MFTKYESINLTCLSLLNKIVEGFISPWKHWLF